jgi:hypothetical protein
MAEELTHWKKLTNPEYIGAYSLQPNEQKTVTIVNVCRQKVKGTDGKEQDCTVAILLNEKPFILNKTNCKILTKIFGTPYIENWKEKRIIIHAEPVRAFGETVDAIRVLPLIPILPTLVPTSPKWEGAVQALRESKTTIEAIMKGYQLTEENKELLIKQSK